MLNALPKESQYVFGNKYLRSHRSNFTRQRRRIAKKLQNPRLDKITFHTLRHWKATMEYHKTKDIIHVQQLLGHRSILNTMIYTHLVNFENPGEFTCRLAKTLDEAKELIEAGFEYITDMDSLKLFRKRK
jgi:integrase